MLAIEIIDDVVAWDDYVANHREATQYHRAAWLEVIRAAFGHRTFALGARSDGRIVGVLPLVRMQSLLFGKFLVSLPFLNYGGMLADDEAIEAKLWEGAIGIARASSCDHIESRQFRPRPFAVSCRQHKATMILALPGSADDLWKAFNAKLRNQIRKAERSGLVARSGGAELLPQFYEIFARTMRDLGTPVYTPRFFREVFAAFPETSRVFLVESDGAPVAAGIGLSHRDTLEVPWAGSLREHRSQSPNNLLYWEAIRFAIAARLERFDFGRSTPDDGPYRYKQQWGAKPVPLYWDYWLQAPGGFRDASRENAKFRVAIEVWKRLPLAVTKWIGPSIVRGIP